MSVYRMCRLMSGLICSRANSCLPSQAIFTDLKVLYSSPMQSLPRWDHVSDGNGDFVVRRIEGAEEALKVGAPRRQDGLVARDRVRSQVEGDVGKDRVLRRDQGVSKCAAVLKVRLGRVQRISTLYSRVFLKTGLTSTLDSSLVTALGCYEYKQCKYSVLVGDSIAFF